MIVQCGAEHGCDYHRGIRVTTVALVTLATLFSVATAALNAKCTVAATSSFKNWVFSSEMYSRWLPILFSNLILDSLVCLVP